MQTQILIIAMGACLLASPAVADTELAHPMPTRQAFRLDPATGCFRYSGTAAEFVGRLRRGAYVSVTMDDPERIPVMDAPEFRAPGGLSWFGPLPATRDYSIMYTPAMRIGTPAKVVICGTTSPPASAEEAARADAAMQRMLDTLEEPQAVATGGPDGKGEQADVCGFRVRDVILKAGDAPDAHTLQPRVTGSVRHYDGVLETPFPVFATCIPAEAGQVPKTVPLPANTRDCYFTGGRLECSYLAEDEVVHMGD
ncbi:hypothetical protein QTA58_23455 [Neorhizobium sp. CSC1952]|uniref:hypothetical protein n=1 Tax=Neorhizobium sp. CSC1952 TaxID=2978974 RepID=UPI0025A6342B|nr:hypothetical protein [Rhizobium sp. CSC1952]WJR67099.1 hypothetical protein QTA58_23455 [Rhizobium sp. CSC1952]